MGRFLKRMFKLGLVAAAAYAVWRWFEAQRAQSDVQWESQPPPYPPQPRVETSSTSTSPSTSSSSNPSSSNPSPAAAATAEPARPVPATEPATARPPTAASGGGDAWVEPVDGACPVTHPVKAKLSSKIFHVAGGLNYERTKPDRCYRDPAAAEADGLRKAAR